MSTLVAGRIATPSVCGKDFEACVMTLLCKALNPTSAYSVWFAAGEYALRMSPEL
jgi:hypothetical protein